MMTYTLSINSATRTHSAFSNDCVDSFLCIYLIKEREPHIILLDAAAADADMMEMDAETFLI